MKKVMTMMFMFAVLLLLSAIFWSVGESYTGANIQYVLGVILFLAGIVLYWFGEDPDHDGNKTAG